MDQSQKFELILPGKKGCESEILQTQQCVLIVGANGAGKTRLGSWIDLDSPPEQCKKSHRISAQKSLTMHDNTSLNSLEKSENELLYGSVDAPENIRNSRKRYNRWNNQPATIMSNDFDALLRYLFSDDAVENSKYKDKSKLTQKRVEPPITKLDKLKILWERILPQRELKIHGVSIKTNRCGCSDLVNASEMSDGERVVFYLIGQCLSAQAEGIIVIDEPELHLHQSIQDVLWQEIEKLRPDCLFVYITHNVDFAAAKENATKIWLKSFDMVKKKEEETESTPIWDWEMIEPDGDLPEKLLLEVLGSRRPVVFVEGDGSSHDVALYREILPEFLVKPCGGCAEVIEAVKALKKNQQFKNSQYGKVYGLIDRDRRRKKEIDALEEDGIFVIDVAEVENLFCTKEVLEIVSKKLDKQFMSCFKKGSQAIFNHLKSELEVQISSHVGSEVMHRLKTGYNAKARGEAELSQALKTLVNEINVKDMYAEVESEFNKIIQDENYDELLRVYNNKGLLSKIASAYGYGKAHEFSEQVLCFIKGSGRVELTNAIKKHLGNFNS